MALRPRTVGYRKKVQASWKECVSRSKNCNHVYEKSSVRFSTTIYPIISRIKEDSPFDSTQEGGRRGKTERQGNLRQNIFSKYSHYIRTDTWGAHHGSVGGNLVLQAKNSLRFLENWA